MAQDPQIKIVTLDAGQRAPDDSDWIRIERVADDKFNVSGFVRSENSHIISDGRCVSFDEAKLVGAFWAEHRGSKLIYVEHDGA